MPTMNILSQMKLRHKAWLAALLFLSIGFLWVNLDTSFAQDSHGTGDEVQYIDAVHTPAACQNVDYGALALDTDSESKTYTELDLLEMIYKTNNPSFVLPPNPDGATLVDIGIYVMEITDVDAEDNTFTVEGFLDLAWCDPREAFNPEIVGVEREIFLEERAELRLNHMWSPDVELVNETRSREQENEELLIYPDGTVEYREKFQATLATDFDMRRFPFDTQTLLIEIESFAWSSHDLVFHVDDEVIGFSDEFSIPEWTIEEVKEHVESKQEVRDRDPFSELVVEITVKRDPGFYLTKIMIPLAIIVMISWSVFWMIGDGLVDRMSVSFTGVLTSVAYQFIVSESLPKHIYNTFMDAVVLLSFIMMVLTIVENILVNTLYLHENETAANRMDKTSRWLFPLVYFGGLVVLTFIYLL